MKLRQDFVTNSSSSSYIVIVRKSLSDEELERFVHSYISDELKNRKQLTSELLNVLKDLRDDSDVLIKDMAISNVICDDDHVITCCDDIVNDDVVIKYTGEV